MTTLNKIIYEVRNIRFKGLAADDYNISNRQIVHWINKLREQLITEKIEKGVIVSDTYIQPLNVTLTCKDYSSEACLASIIGTTGLTAMVSETIPAPIPYRDITSGKGSIFTFFGTVGGHSIHFCNWEALEFEKYRKHRVGAYGSFKDNKIYLFDANGTDVLQPRGLFQNPLEAARFNCPDCFDYDSDYPIDGKMESVILKLIEDNYLRTLLNPATKQDTTNDAKEVI